MSEPTIAMCDVCFLVDGDQRQKVSYYCPKCDAWICENCIPRKVRRAYAMFRRKWFRFVGVTDARI